VVVTQPRLAGRVPPGRYAVLALDPDSSALGDVARERLGPTATAGDLAYVMYTSGSTGRPKGVCVPHRAVVRLVKSVRYARLGPEEVFLQFAPISFDASTFEIWGALLNGARLVVAPPGTLSLAELGQTIRRHGITTLWLTAGLFHEMVDHELPALAGVRQLLAGGDVLSVLHVQRVLDTLSCTLINGYGPTEATTFAVTHAMTPGTRVDDRVPIGRPITNTEVYVLEANGQPAPVGVVGELHIGGPGLARGYLNQAALTAERFVSHPFDATPGARLYRTGDLAQYRADGCIEFVGRTDDQVKIRGHRVEVGEIETLLRGHPAVHDCVTTAFPDASGTRRLVAYVVPRPGPPPPVEELRRFLGRTLPAYMVPAAIVLLDALPLTANGKPDRHALSPPPAARPALGARYIAPRGETEDAIASVWREVLQVDRVGVHDSFFDLGGHSLALLRVHGRLSAALGRAVSLMDLFRYPTVSTLAGYLDGRDGDDEQAPGDRANERMAGADRLGQLRELRRRAMGAEG
jgi:amino acid adenylation domain-containing protein